MDAMTGKDSILTSTKKLIGLGPDYDAFNLDLVTHINSVLMIMHQLGVGPKEEFTITGPDETWDDFWGGEKPINLARTYLALKTRIIFDPPTSGVLHEALERQIEEVEWRLVREVEEREAGL